ncbi:MAG: hypothetical protein ACRDTM_11855 [Micromonosporaceae bacterium]
MPGQRVDHHAEPQQIGRPAVIEAGMTYHRRKLHHRGRQHRIGGEALLDGV